MIFDFSFILVAATALTGVIWGIDSWLFKPQRVAAGVARGVAPEEVREPVVVEYARSFFPVILIVLLIRSFLFEPFRIPSDSMMPTLLDGDFIFVNKYAYGLRLPVINSKIVAIDEPHRGDVIVFRLPSDPSTNYIKRLIGLPGESVRIIGGNIYTCGLDEPESALRIARKPPHKLSAMLQDINGDGLLDLIIHINASEIQLTSFNSEAIVEGLTVDGKFFWGTDTIEVAE